jgi:hypothetical protein
MLESLIDALQWPATAATLLAAWLIASPTPHRRNTGFWCFIVSNLLWVLWGWQTGAYALIMLQVGLFGLNLRGAQKT